MNYISLFLIILITAYWITTTVKFGAPKSFSDSWYQWSQVGYSDVFAWFIIGVGCLVAAMPLVYEYKDISSVLLMFTGAFLCGVGIAANFKDQGVGTKHVISTYAAIACAFLAVIINGYPSIWTFVPFCVSVILIILIQISNLRNKTAVQEGVLFYAVLGQLTFL